MTKTTRELYNQSYRLERQFDFLFWELSSLEPNTNEYRVAAIAVEGNEHRRHHLADDCFAALGSCHVVNHAYDHLHDRIEFEMDYIGSCRSIHQRISVREPGHFLTEMICKQQSGKPSPFNTQPISGN